MSELRWILIGFGIALLAGIYLWGRRSNRGGSDDAVLRVRPEPSLQTREPTAAHHDTPLAAEEAIDPEAPAAGADDEYVITAVRPAAPRSSVPRSSGAGTPGAGATARVAAPEDVRRGRVEPTLDDDPVAVTGVDPEGDARDDNGDPTLDVTQTAELPARPEAAPAPTLSSSDSPPVRRIERRKILALRLAAAPHRYDGARLQESLHAEALEYGKYDVYHRLHTDGASIFSVASMVEPGTFDTEKMLETQYPGVTLFAQLPGPVPGMHALNELVACARRLQQSLGGTLQDDRGVPLTVHRIERLRQEVREFERPAAGAGGSRGSPTAPSVAS